MFKKYQQVEHDSLIIATITLIVFESLAIILYFVLSKPGLAVLNGIINGNSHIPQMTWFGPLHITVFNMMFAISFIIPPLWFFLWVNKRHSGYEFRRFY